MQTTTAQNAELIESSAAKTAASAARLKHLLSFVPDDKLAWSPSSTSRSALGLAAHCGLTSRSFVDLMLGRMPDPMPSLEVFFKELIAAEKTIDSREAANALIDDSTQELIAGIRNLTDEQIASSPETPFGPVPMTRLLELFSLHIDGHIAQLEYLQTTWGDLDLHY